MTATTTLFSVTSFFTLILVCIPFPWHLEAWNTGTCLYMAWTALGLLVYFVNSVVWHNDAVNYAPGWCDLSTKLIIGSSVAIPAASLCINRRLYYISTVRTVTWARNEKLRAVATDLAIGLGIPILVMILHYVVQGHRFDIYEEIGCMPATYNTWLTYLILYVPNLVICVISGTYAVMSILTFRRCQKEFQEILSSKSNLNTNRFLRLIALASIDVLMGFPLNLAIFCLNAATAQPWISWEDTHYEFSRVDQFPASMWRMNSVSQSSLEFNRWMVVVCGLIFFLFFGFADEAQKNYKLAINSIAKRVGLPGYSTTKAGKINTVSSSFGTTPLRTDSDKHKELKGVGPIYISKEIMSKRDSIITFTDMTSISDSDTSSKPPSPTIPRQFHLTSSKASPASLSIPPNSGKQGSTEIHPGPGMVPQPSHDSFLDLSKTPDEIRPGNEHRV